MKLHLTSFALCKVCSINAGVVRLSVCASLEQVRTHSQVQLHFQWVRTGRGGWAVRWWTRRPVSFSCGEAGAHVWLEGFFLQLFSLESPLLRILLSLPAPPLSLSAACRPVVDALILTGDNEHFKHSPVFRGMLYVVQNVMCSFCSRAVFFSSLFDFIFFYIICFKVTNCWSSKPKCH